MDGSNELSFDVVVRFLGGWPRSVILVQPYYGPTKKFSVLQTCDAGDEQEHHIAANGSRIEGKQDRFD